jgi:hypothetical protein
MNDFLGKPFFVQSLIEAIQAMPLYEERMGDPSETNSQSSPAFPPDELADAPSQEGPSGHMSWMPDLTSSGDNAIVEQAVAEIPEILTEIDEALAHGDGAVAAERAHYLKNTIYALHIQPMSSPCLTVFERSTAGDLASAQRSMEILRTAFDSWNADRNDRKSAGGHG